MRRAGPALVLALVACYRYEPPKPAEPREGTLVRASHGETWDAVIDLFALRNIPIRTIERVSGIIATEALRVDPVEGAAWADCGTMGDVELTPTTAIYNVLVRGDSAESTVRTTVNWSYAGDELNYECSSSHVWERNLEREVKARAEATHSVTAAVDTSPAAPSGGPPPPSPVAGSPGTRTQRPPAGRVAPLVGRIRPNDHLLESSEFRTAVEDARRLRIVVTYREFAPETLTVELGDGAFTSPSAEHNLGRLFRAYRNTTERRSDGALELHHDGRRVGLYTGSGIRWEQVR
jgi:hypothetical protein